MKTKSPPVNRPWNLDGWGLRWKVTAVVALPITVAMVFGGLQVQDEFSRAVDYSAAADKVSSVPVIVTLSNDYALLSAGYSAGTFKSSDIGDFRKTIDGAHAAAENPALPADLADVVRSSLVVVEALVSDIEAGTVARPDLPAETAKVSGDLMHVVDEIVGPIQDPDVVVAVRHLHDLAGAKQALSDQVAGMMTHLMDTSKPPSAMVAAGGAELALIDAMMRSYPDSIPVLEKTRDSGRARLDLIINNPASQIQFKMRDLLYGSVTNYTELVGKTSNVIADTVTARADAARSAAWSSAAIVLATMLATIALGVLVARSLIRPISRLRRGALKVTNEDLPAAIGRIKAGDADVSDFEPIPVHTTEEIGQLARAVDAMHGQALRLAGEQAQLRVQVGDMFETLARRSKSLVDQQLSLIENLEFEEKDPRRLESLFRLDHLAARMRRNGENLLILSGTRTRRSHSEPVQVGDVLRAAMSEVEDYQRVEVGSTPQGAIAGAVATDIVHLLAELLDNSLRASPPESKVTFDFARAVDGGLLLEIADRGIGIPAAELAKVNERLASGGEVSADTARHMGLYVISELAAQHGLTVRMRATFDTVRNQGVTTSVHIPHTALVSTAAMGMTGPQATVEAYDDGPAALRQTATHSALTPETRQGPVVPVSVTVGPGPITLAPDFESDGGPAPMAEQPGAGSPLPQRTPGVAAGFTEGAPDRPAAPAQPNLDRPAAPAQPNLDRPAAPAQPNLDRPAAVPSHTPGATVGLPQRTPGATPGLPRPSDAAASAVAPTPAPQPVVDPAPVTGPDADDPARARRHRYRLNSEKTASFFMARPRPEEPPALLSTETTPIFMGMVSDWLTDPTDSEVSPAWKSAADVGWDAANRATGPRDESRTASGLPQRRPGHRLVPGRVEGADKINTPPRLRDPDAIREKLSRHQQGIREGRAAGQAERNSI